MDWQQIWEIVRTPDNIAVLLLMAALPFYLWYGLRQAVRNDARCEMRESASESVAGSGSASALRQGQIPELEKEKVDVWPHLLKIELLAAILVTVLLLLWSVLVDAPLEAPADPNVTMNPAKAPWYFVGLQELLVYFDPWIAGVMIPLVAIFGLLAIPYIDPNPAGSGYYCWRERSFAISCFLFGFLGLWILPILVGVFLRGPGWMWFWPGETWDPHLMAPGNYHSLSGLLGYVALLGYVLVVGGVFHAWFTRKLFVAYGLMSRGQYFVLQGLVLLMLAVPAKVICWHLFSLKYVLVTPWFRI